MKKYIDLARPFTLVAPALGFLSGAASAYGAAPREPWHAGVLVAPSSGPRWRRSSTPATAH